MTGWWAYLWPPAAWAAALLWLSVDDWLDHRKARRSGTNTEIRSATVGGER